MSSKKSPVKKAQKVVIEDYNGQKSLWNGKGESTKVTFEVRSLQIEATLTTRNFLRKFTAPNYLEACSVLKLSPSKRYVVVDLDSPLESLFQEGQMKTIKLYVKYDRNSGLTYSDLLRVSFSKDISLNIKDKDRKAILWNGKQFVYKMKFNLTDSDMMNHTLETLLKPHAALNYLLEDCSAKLMSPKYENILTPISMKDIVGSFVIDASATIYLQNTGEPNEMITYENTMTKMDLDFELVPLPSCSSIEMIEMEEINTIPKKILKASQPRSDSKHFNPWSKQDWKGIRALIMQLERDCLTTMGYRHVSEDDRKKLVDELWALNRAFKKSDADVNEVLCHFEALESVVANNHPIKDKSKESHKNKYKWNNFFEGGYNSGKGLHCNRATLMKNPRKKNRQSIRLSQFVDTLESPELKPSEPLPLTPFKSTKTKEPSERKMSSLKCPDCRSNLICLKCRNKKNFGFMGDDEEDCWFQEERDRIGIVYIVLAFSVFVLMLVFIYFNFSSP